METQHLFGLDGLTALGARTGADMRPTLLRVLTDLYVHRLSHTPEEERHYTELALRLLEAVDAPTRVAVARRFAGYISPPLRVLQWLTRDLPEVRAQLRSHPLLQPIRSSRQYDPQRCQPLTHAVHHLEAGGGRHDGRARFGHRRRTDRAVFCGQTRSSGALFCSTSTSSLQFPPEASR